MSIYLGRENISAGVKGEPGGVTKLVELEDVDVSTPSSGEVLKYEDGKWINGVGASSQVSVLPDPEDTELGTIVQYIGEDDFPYENGQFYKLVDEYRYEIANVYMKNNPDHVAKLVVDYGVLLDQGYEDLNTDFTYTSDDTWVSPDFPDIEYDSEQLKGNFGISYDNYNLSEGDILHLDYWAPSEEGTTEIYWKKLHLSTFEQIKILPNINSLPEGLVFQYIGDQESAYGWALDQNHFYKITGPEGERSIEGILIDGEVYYGNIQGYIYQSASARDNAVIKLDSMVFNTTKHRIQDWKMFFDGKIIQYVGTTDSTYTQGYFYKCTFAGTSYSWERVDVQPIPTFDELTNRPSYNGTVMTHTTNIPEVKTTTWDGKQNAITGAATTITSSNLTTNRALVSNASGKVAVSAITSTELGYLDGVTSAIQTQLNGKQANISDLATIRSGAALGTTSIQPNDNVSELTNDAGYQTSEQVSFAISTHNTDNTAHSDIRTAVASKSTVSVSATGTATDEVQYITIDGVEKKLAGGSGGANTDLSNITAAGKETAVSWGMPDYDAGVDISTTVGNSFTMPVDAIVYARAGDTSRIGVYKDNSNGVELTYLENVNKNTATDHFIVEKGTVLYVLYRNGSYATLRYFPLKGVN